jgi:hypothetical protein
VFCINKQGKTRKHYEGKNKMKKLVITLLLVTMVVGTANLFAGKGNDFPSGPHYELGLIGRPNVYTGSGTDDSKRHTIFIPLDTDGYVDGKIKIQMKQGSEFLVIDGDATADGTAKLQIGPGYYAVFARALGKPGGDMDIDAFFTYWEDEGVMSDAVFLGHVDLTRVRRKPQTVEISKLFYFTGSITVIEEDVSIIYTYTNEWIFDVDYLADYWWDVVNHGLKRLEIRFYPVEEGYVPPEVVPTV